jgi:hypothetical protein
MNMAQDPADDCYDFLNDDFDGGLLFMDKDDQVMPLEKPNCQTRLFGSQETPPAAGPFTEPQTVRHVGISPNTFRKVVDDAIRTKPGGEGAKAKDEGQGKKKMRKRGAGGGASQPTPKPIRAIDGPPRPKVMKLHTGGVLMTSQTLLNAATTDMRSVISAVQTIEKRMIKERDPSYPVFVCKVPEGVGFVDRGGAEFIILRFADIFDMLHLNPLHYTMVRLFSLSLTMQIIREQTRGLAIADPYYMREAVLGNCFEHQKIASDYLKGLMLQNKEAYILVPYFPE